MYKGTTPQIAFSVPNDIDLASIKEAWVTFAVGQTKLTLKLSEQKVVIDESDNALKVHLTQEQTLALEAGRCETQVRFLMQNNEAFCSKIMNISVKDILEGGVIE